MVIGDVHGHYDGLMRLIDLIQPTSADELYFLGDLVDRGPKSYQVVEFVKSSGYQSLRGNHEELMIAACNPADHDFMAFQLWVTCGGRQTLESYSSSAQIQGHIAWLETLPLYLDLGDYWLVHAGVHPHKKLDQQTSEEFCWIRHEFHRMSRPYFEHKTIITGHTITFTLPNVGPGQVAQGTGWLGIDTGVYHPKSGWLTALDVLDQQVYQVNVFSHQTQVLALEAALASIYPQSLHTSF
ncbi:serine/threonine protein phosphatase [Lyngbya confervoides BDU141951]|uniref:Serine/threonine protein phosphatase n=1 Tax=Lyngbya confervoides BDU141951 TaxID=1574623 RepID=A0ABD4T4W7_9CYAN|nr:metallophosphoesterase family protein [Lyngbya confervoides]MCM1983458.1 serine/threonine protein phosphatase [Lyngbya confervoides BDU141951]